MTYTQDLVVFIGMYAYGWFVASFVVPWNIAAESGRITKGGHIPKGAFVRWAMQLLRPHAASQPSLT